jgi:signal transduction histidine kinase
MSRLACLSRSWLLGLALASAIAAPALAQSQRQPWTTEPWTTVFTQAEFVLDHSPRPPGDAAGWQTVKLPHRWDETHGDAIGRGWYRIRVDFAEAPRSTQAIVIVHVRSLATEFFVNGTLVGSSRDSVGGEIGLGPVLRVPIPPSFFRPGENVIHARMQVIDPLQGLGRVHFGHAWSLRTIAQTRSTLNAQRMFLAMALAAGLISLFVWFARRTDRVMLWFAIATLSWGSVGLLAPFHRYVPYAVDEMLNAYVTYGMPVPAAILALRTVDLRWPKLEAVLWAFLAGEVLHPNWEMPVARTSVLCVLDSVNAGLLVAAAAIIVFAPGRRLGWAHRVEAAALVAMALMMLHEVLRYFGLVDVENVVMRPYHVPVMLAAIGATIFERHVSAVRQGERTNLELQALVDAKARELEAYHTEREEVLRQQALMRERQRILADMHDGVGASLVGLQRYARSGQVDAKVVEQRAREAMQELRIAIDALEPAEGDLGVVLGNLRYRMEPLVESTGARLGWEVGELPPVQALEPAAVFSIQRILLEAISNALQHSGARHIRLSARPNGDRIEIRVADDGAGYDAPAGRPGLGLGTMRARAQKLGAALEIASRRGEGTTVSLTIPCQLAPA